MTVIGEPFSHCTDTTVICNRQYMFVIDVGTPRGYRSIYGVEEQRVQMLLDPFPQRNPKNRDYFKPIMMSTFGL